MSFSSDELNYLIYRYLKESGFEHTCFTFAAESKTLEDSSINPQDVLPGALVNVIQKGLLYMEVEAHVVDEGNVIECDQPFSLIKPHMCKVRESNNGTEPMQIDNVTTINNSVKIPQENVTTLEGHTAEVFSCSWNSKTNLLASGSGDGTGIIWRVPEKTGADATTEANMSSIILDHSNSEYDGANKDVTIVDWSPNGEHLATGSYDGLVRVWDSQGRIKMRLAKHRQAIFSLKWNKSGTYLLSGSLDKTSIVWNAANGQIVQQFSFHDHGTLDVDWKEDNIFASCSGDRAIYVCEIGKTKPIQTWRGHENEVNSICWDTPGNLLASCSDDATAKIWKFGYEDYVLSFNHSRDIYTVKWSPSGPGTIHSEHKPILASGSVDATVKIWDVEEGVCIHNFSKHNEAVYSVDFSPNGEYLATGSFDSYLHIWSMTDGSLVKTYKGQGGIFDVCWNKTGDKIAVGYATNHVCVLDIKM
eukprot:TRINITY_DN6972_c0_g1_i1.p1 TRINITY_DN6972_c0_g1~~TRINITY_DN6972_c0_g1_i1.p1  ORF type:complete len:474 (-),score=78.85 TRINITY_DN6972_c0_g1_i1:73-1494(-)